MKSALPGIAVALGGAAIDILLFEWAIGIERDDMLPEMNLGPLVAVGVVGVALLAGGLVFAYRSRTPGGAAVPHS
jgi:hypothetical protein